MTHRYAHKDGYTYYWKGDVLYGCPTFKGGKPDLDNELPVSDFAEPLTIFEKAYIKSQLIITAPRRT